MGFFYLFFNSNAIKRIDDIEGHSFFFMYSKIYTCTVNPPPPPKKNTRRYTMVVYRKHDYFISCSTV